MKPTGIIRHIDNLGQVTIPKEIRQAFKIKEGDPLEIYTARDGSVIIKPHRKSWEECVIDFYDSHWYLFRNGSPYNFYHHGCYTICVKGSDSSKDSCIGVAKRYAKDKRDYRIGRVAAYAHAIGKPIDELIGYEG